MSDSPVYDVAVVGAGPAGSTCAALCAQNGMSVLLLERSAFPREKVCGDCVNPLCWPVLERLAVADRVASLPHARLDAVEFAGSDGRRLRYDFAASERPEIAVKRSALDHLLLQRAQELGAQIREETALTSLQRIPSSNVWRMETAAGAFEARTLVAADGRNSTVARLLGYLPPQRKDRVGLQTHLPLPSALAGCVRMQFLRHGYCGVADVGGSTANLCLVSTPPRIAALKAWASAEFGLPEDHVWRTITPLARTPISPLQNGVLFVGDAARVVEPFTGEGIYYALASGELAARSLCAQGVENYAAAHARLYAGRLWINRLARFACEHPLAADALLKAARLQPSLLGMLTRKVIQSAKPACVSAG